MTIDLSGQWAVRLDPDDTGGREGWHDRPFEGRIALPGSTAQAGLGNDASPQAQWTGTIIDHSWFTDSRYAKYREAGNVKLPFWLTPTKWYVGPAWYRRVVRVPPSWRGQRVLLHLERAHWTTKLWLDGIERGTCDSLATPHEYDLGELSPGEHTLTIRVDNRMHVEVGVDAHSVSDHTQTNWNGIIGRIELRARPTPWIEDVQIYPRIDDRTARISIRVGGGPFATAPQVAFQSPVVRGFSCEWHEDLAECAVQFADDAQLWDEFSPVLHPLEVRVGEDSRTLRFGLRQFGKEGKQFTINGRPVFLRGTLECCIFPLTGYPPTDVDSWKRIMRTVKAHGLNHVRFHSWCPPRAAFDAADEIGVYLQIEVCTWPNAHVVEGPTSGSGLGNGLAIDCWIHDETARIIRRYGNHPSFVMLAVGNEPGGQNQAQYLTNWLTKIRAVDSRRLYTGTSGWPELEQNDYHVVPQPRIQQWGEGLASRINARPPETCSDYRDFIAARNVPVVSHEIGQWCAYPDLEQIGKHTGVTRAANFEIFRDSLADHHMLDQARDFLHASGKLQALCYKEEIESALRTPGMGGFQLLDLHDFPGQGTALVGVLDAFWDSKGYISVDEFRRFACETVPLARLPRRVFTAEQTLEAQFEIAHFGSFRIDGAHPVWRLIGASGEVARGLLPRRNIEIGNGISLGSVSVPLHQFPTPSKYSLRLEVAGYENSWDIWIYPSNVDVSPGDVLITQSTADALAAAQSGKRVLLTAPPGGVTGDELGAVQLGFSPIFWNTAWTKRQAPHTLGILCDPAHPALRLFPTDAHADWQCWELLHEGQAMILDRFPANHRPIVQVIDDWVTNRRLGLLLEAKVGAGRLMVSGMRLSADQERPVARQMLASLLEYMKSDGFNPPEVDASTLKRLFSD